MIQHLLHSSLFRKIAIAVIIAYAATIPASSGYAQVVKPLPAPGQMVPVSGRYAPPVMAGLQVNLKNPFNLHFVLSNGQKVMNTAATRDEYSRLIKYFMAALVIPNNDIWVNLSPNDASRIIPDGLANTEMGRDLLAQDYLLKQFTASLMYPEDQVGKDFWQRVYARAYEKYGTTDVPVDTFNKVWIMADKADIYQKNDTALLVSSHLKVMLEQDFMSIQANRAQFGAGLSSLDTLKDDKRKLASDMVRDVIIPVIEKEVNEGENFAQVRQIYQSMILATWFKKALKDSLLGQVYADSGKVAGIEGNDPKAKERIYAQYLEAYKTGVFNYIKEEQDILTQEVLPRKYFSGGMVAVSADVLREATFDQAMTSMNRLPGLQVANVALVAPAPNGGNMSFGSASATTAVAVSDMQASDRAQKARVLKELMAKIAAARGDILQRLATLKAQRAGFMEKKGALQRALAYVERALEKIKLLRVPDKNRFMDAKFAWGDPDDNDFYVSVRGLSVIDVVARMLMDMQKYQGIRPEGSFQTVNEAKDWLKTLRGTTANPVEQEENAVLWLNESIIPFRIYTQMKDQGVLTQARRDKVESVLRRRNLPLSLSMPDDDLKAFGKTSDGFAVKKAILNALYGFKTTQDVLKEMTAQHEVESRVDTRHLGTKLFLLSMADLWSGVRNMLTLGGDSDERYRKAGLLLTGLIQAGPAFSVPAGYDAPLFPSTPVQMEQVIPAKALADLPAGSVLQAGMPGSSVDEIARRLVSAAYGGEQPVEQAVEGGQVAVGPVSSSREAGEVDAEAETGTPMARDRITGAIEPAGNLDEYRSVIDFPRMARRLFTPAGYVQVPATARVLLVDYNAKDVPMKQLVSSGKVRPMTLVENGVKRTVIVGKILLSEAAPAARLPEMEKPAESKAVPAADAEPVVPVADQTLAAPMIPASQDLPRAFKPGEVRKVDPGAVRAEGLKRIQDEINRVDAAKQKIALDQLKAQAWLANLNGDLDRNRELIRQERANAGRSLSGFISETFLNLYFPNDPVVVEMVRLKVLTPVTKSGIAGYVVDGNMLIDREKDLVAVPRSLAAQDIWKYVDANGEAGLVAAVHARHARFLRSLSSQPGWAAVKGAWEYRLAVLGKEYVAPATAMSDRADFDKILAVTLRLEGGYGEPNGIPTKYGIIQVTYDAYRNRKGLSLQNVSEVTPAEARDIYYNMYYHNIGLDQLPNYLAGLLFDISVVAGPGRARATLLEALPELNRTNILREIIRSARQVQDTSDAEAHIRKKIADINKMSSTPVDGVDYPVQFGMANSNYLPMFGAWTLLSSTPSITTVSNQLPINAVPQPDGTVFFLGKPESKVDTSVPTWQFIVNIPHPYQEWTVAYQIASGLGNIGAQATINQILGPVYLLDKTMTFYNYMVMDKYDGQTKAYTVGSENWMEAIAKTLVVNVKGAHAANQLNEFSSEMLVNMGIADTIAAFPRGLNLLTGGLVTPLVQFLGSVNNRAPFEEQATFLEYGAKEYAFMLAAANKDPVAAGNVLFTKRTDVVNAERYRLDIDKNTREQKFVKDANGTFVPAHTRMIITTLGVDGRSGHREVAASPAFIDVNYLEEQTKDGPQAKQPLLQRILVETVLSWKSLQMEADLLRQSTMDLRTGKSVRVLGATRGLDGGVNHLITAKEEMSQLKSQKDANGKVLFQYLPGSSLQPLNPSDVTPSYPEDDFFGPVKHYNRDQFLKPWHQWRNFVGYVVPEARYTAAEAAGEVSIAERPNGVISRDDLETILKNEGVNVTVPALEASGYVTAVKGHEKLVTLNLNLDKVSEALNERHVMVEARVLEVLRNVPAKYSGAADFIAGSPTNGSIFVPALEQKQRYERPEIIGTDARLLFLDGSAPLGVNVPAGVNVPVVGWLYQHDYLNQEGRERQLNQLREATGPGKDIRKIMVTVSGHAYDIVEDWPAMIRALKKSTAGEIDRIAVTVAGQIKGKPSVNEHVFGAKTMLQLPTPFGLKLAVMEPLAPMAEREIPRIEAAIERTLIMARLADPAIDGVEVNAATGAVRAVETAKGFVQADKTHGAGQRLLVPQAQDESRSMVVPAGMWVKLNAQGRVTAFLLPGVRMLDERRDVLEVLKAGGREVENRATGKVEVYASSNALTPRQIELGVKPERELVALIAANRTTMVPTGTKGLERMVILSKALPRISGYDPVAADTMQEFFDRNALILWKKVKGFPTAQWVSRQALETMTPVMTTVSVPARSTGKPQASAEPAARDVTGAPKAVAEAIGASAAVPERVKAPRAATLTVDGRPAVGYTVEAETLTVSDLPLLAKSGANMVRSFYPMTVAFAEQLAAQAPNIRKLVIGIPLDNKAYQQKGFNRFWGEAVPKQGVSLESDYIGYIRAISQAMARHGISVDIEIGNELFSSWGAATWNYAYKGKAVTYTEEGQQVLAELLSDTARNIHTQVSGVRVGTTLADKNPDFQVNAWDRVLSLGDIDFVTVNGYRGAANRSFAAELVAAGLKHNKTVGIGEMGEPRHTADVNIQAANYAGYVDVAHQSGLSIALMSFKNNPAKSPTVLGNEKELGVLDALGNRKPAYRAVQEAIARSFGTPSAVTMPVSVPAAPVAEAVTFVQPVSPEKAEYLQRNSVEIVGLSAQDGQVNGRMAKVYGGALQMVLTTDATRFFNENMLLFFKDGRLPEFISVRDLTRIGNTGDIATNVKEILKLTKDGKTEGRMVAMYGKKFQLWLTKDLKQRFDRHYLLKYAPDSQGIVAPAEFVTLDQLKANYADISTRTDQVVKLQPVDNKGHFRVSGNIYLMPDYKDAELGVVDSNNRSEKIYSLEKQQFKGVAYQRNTLTVNGKSVLVIDRRDERGVVQKVFGVVVPRDSGIVAANELEGEFGKTYLELFGTTFMSGNPAEGKAFIGFRDDGNGRPIYRFNMLLNEQGKQVYAIDQTKNGFIGYAGAGEALVLSPETREALKLPEVHIGGQFAMATFPMAEIRGMAGVAGTDLDPMSPSSVWVKISESDVILNPSWHSSDRLAGYLAQPSLSQPLRNLLEQALKSERFVDATVVDRITNKEVGKINEVQLNKARGHVRYYSLGITRADESRDTFLLERLQNSNVFSRAFLDAGLNEKETLSALVDRGYVSKEGVVQDQFNALQSSSEMSLPSDLMSKADTIYNVLRQFYHAPLKTVELLFRSENLRQLTPEYLNRLGLGQEAVRDALVGAGLIDATGDIQVKFMELKSAKELPQSLGQLKLAVYDALKQAPVKSVSLADLKTKVGVGLDKKLEETIARFTADMGITSDHIQFVASVQRNEKNGTSVFYRLKGAPLPLVFVYQSVIDERSATFTVHTDFTDGMPSKAYERTPLDEFVYIESQGTYSIAGFERENGLDISGVELTEAIKATLDYRAFVDQGLIKVAHYRLSKGVVDGVINESVKDQMLTRWLAPGDPLSLDLVKKEPDRIRLMRHEDVAGNKKFADKPFVVMSGEVSFGFRDQRIHRITEYAGTDMARHIYLYKVPYELDEHGDVFRDPEITIGYMYDTGIVGEWYLGKGYVVYSYAEYTVPLQVRLLTESLWNQMNFLNARHYEEKAALSFDIRLMTEPKTGQALRLVQEVPFPGASFPDKIESRLYLGDRMLARENDGFVRLEVEHPTGEDVRRNGLVGVLSRNIGTGDYGYLVEIAGKDGKTETIDVKRMIEEMQDVENKNVDVMRVNTEKANEMIRTSAPPEAGIVRDFFLNAWTYLSVAVFATAMASAAGFLKRLFRRDSKRKLSAGTGKSDNSGPNPKDSPADYSRFLPGLEKKLAVFLAVNNSIVGKKYHTDEQGAGKAHLLKMLASSMSFFGAGDVVDGTRMVEHLANMSDAGHLPVMDEINIDPTHDLSVMPEFNELALRTIKDVSSEALPIVALQHGIDQGWFSVNEMVQESQLLSREVALVHENGAKWQWLLSRMQEVQLQKFVDSGFSDEARSKIFPDPEGLLLGALIDKNYGDDLKGFLGNKENGITVHQRVERFVKQEVFDPLIRQIYQDIPMLGGIDASRHEALENAVMSEFYRFAAIYPDNIPDKSTRTVEADGHVFFDSSVLDVQYNPRPTLKYSEPSTYRQKVVFHLLSMPLSETGGVSFGPMSGLAPMTLFFTRRLIEAFQAIEKEGTDVDARKGRYIQSFRNEVRFWRAVFQTNNWSSIFASGGKPGLFKWIAEVSGRQPNMYIKEIFHDEYMYSFFQQLLEKKEKDSANRDYDDLMSQIGQKKEFLEDRLKMASKNLAMFKGNVDIGAVLGNIAGISAEDQNDALAALKDMKLIDRDLVPNKGEVDKVKAPSNFKMPEGKSLPKVLIDHGDVVLKALRWLAADSSIAAEGNAQRKTFYEAQLDTWRNDVDGLLRAGKANWTEDQVSLASALASESLFWELSTIKSQNTDKRKDVEKFVRGSLSMADLNMLGHGVSRDLVWKELLRQGYIDGDGIIQPKFYRYRTAEELPLSPSLDAVKNDIFNVFMEKMGPFRQLMGGIINKSDDYRFERHPYAYMVNELTMQWKGELHSWIFRSLAPMVALKPVALILASEWAGLLSKDKRQLIIDKKVSLESSLENYWGIKDERTRKAVTVLQSLAMVLAGWTFFTTYFGLSVIALSAALFGIPLVMATVKYSSERWINALQLGFGTLHLSLLTHLLFKTLAGTIAVSPTLYVTMALMVLLLPHAATMVVQQVRTLVAMSRYQGSIWSKNWRQRTLGWKSWLGWTIKDFGGFNNSGRFYGEVLKELIEVQRERGFILPAGMLVQDYLKLVFHRLSRAVISPDELKALDATVDFQASYKRGMPEQGAAWDSVVAAATAYQAAVTAIQRSGKSKIVYLKEGVSIPEIIQQEIPMTFISPKAKDLKELLYTTFQSLVMEKPIEDVFARMQAVSTHEMSYNEVFMSTLENFGRLGTMNYAGVDKLLPKLRERFRQQLMKDNPRIGMAALKDKDDRLVRAFNVSAYLFDVNAIVTMKGGDQKPLLNDKEQEWLRQELDAALGYVPAELVKAMPLELRESLLKKKYLGRINDQYVVAKAFRELKDVGAFEVEILAYSDEKKVLFNALREVQKTQFALTSLLGYALRSNPETRDNMLGWLEKSRNANYMKPLIERLRKATEMDDIALMVRLWAEDQLYQAQGNSNELMRVKAAITEAEQALVDFMNQLLPNNKKMIDGIKEDVFYTQQAAARAYGDYEYHRDAYQKFLNDGSLVEAAEKDAEFNSRFKQYRSSAKLKTAGMLQFGMIWADEVGFNLTRQYETQDNFNDNEINISSDEYKYVSRAAEKILTSGNRQGDLEALGISKDLLDEWVNAGVLNRSAEKFVSANDVDAVDNKLRGILAEHVSAIIDKVRLNTAAYMNNDELESIGLTEYLRNGLIAKGVLVAPLNRQTLVEARGKKLNVDAVWSALLTAGYIDANGFATGKFQELNDARFFRLDDIPQDQWETIYMLVKDASKAGRGSMVMLGGDIETVQLELLRLMDQKVKDVKDGLVFEQQFRPLRESFMAGLKGASGVKVVRTKDKKRTAVFSKEMIDFSKFFIEFRHDHYAEILKLSNKGMIKFFSDVYEISEYVEESHKAGALIPFYDKRQDDIIPGNKNGGINLNSWMGYHRSYNMDAAVSGYDGSSIYRLNYAALVGRNPEIVIMNPAFRIWTSTNDSFPGVAAYKIAQETFTQDFQRGWRGLGTFYGKGGVMPQAGNAMFTTPGEDSANFIMVIGQYPHAISAHVEWVTWLWGRPSLHAESIFGSEFRYGSNVTRFLMDIGTFEAVLNKNVGVDVKVANQVMFNHYMLTFSVAALLIALPALQGFSAFAYLLPAILFFALAFFGMQAINMMNFSRHWRESGNLVWAIVAGGRDVVKAFPYYVSMLVSISRSVAMAANEKFKFIGTVKTMILSSLERPTRFQQQTTLDWVAHKTETWKNTLKSGGWVVMWAGAVLWALPKIGIAIVSPNVPWLVPVLLTAGFVLHRWGVIIDYMHTDKGFIAVPFDSVVGVAGIMSWFLGVFFTTTMGAVVTLPYVLASIALLTGKNVYSTFTESAVDADGVDRLKISGRNGWAMFTDHPAALGMFIASTALLTATAFVPVTSTVIFGFSLVNIMTWLGLLGVVGSVVAGGAFSTISQAIDWTTQSVIDYSSKVREESERRVSEKLLKSYTEKLDVMTKDMSDSQKKDFYFREKVGIQSGFSNFFNKIAVRVLSFVDRIVALPVRALDWVLLLLEKRNGSLLLDYVDVSLSRIKAFLQMMTGLVDFLFVDVVAQGRVDRSRGMEKVLEDRVQKIEAVLSAGAADSAQASALVKRQEVLLQLVNVLKARHRALLEQEAELLAKTAENQRAIDSTLADLDQVNAQQANAQLMDPTVRLNAVAQAIAPQLSTSDVSTVLSGSSLENNSQDNAQTAPGGITLNERDLTINIKVDGTGMPLPAQMQDPAMNNIQGLVPMIIDITPVSAGNVPALSALMTPDAAQA
jgi:hypothetical protein